MRVRGSEGQQPHRPPAAPPRARRRRRRALGPRSAPACARLREVLLLPLRYDNSTTHPSPNHPAPNLPHPAPPLQTAGAASAPVLGQSQGWRVRSSSSRARHCCRVRPAPPLLNSVPHSSGKHAPVSSTTALTSALLCAARTTIWAGAAPCAGASSAAGPARGDGASDAGFAVRAGEAQEGEAERPGGRTAGPRRGAQPSRQGCKMASVRASGLGEGPKPASCSRGGSGRGRRRAAHPVRQLPSHRTRW